MSKIIEKPKSVGPATVFINARLIDPASNRDEPGGLLVKDGIIADLGSHLRRNAPEGATVVGEDGRGVKKRRDAEAPLAYSAVPT